MPCFFASDRTAASRPFRRRLCSSFRAGSSRSAFFSRLIFGGKRPSSFNSLEPQGRVQGRWNRHLTEEQFQCGARRSCGRAGQVPRVGLGEAFRQSLPFGQ